MKELENCPFCGGKAEREPSINIGYYKVFCADCEIETDFYCDGEDILRWNNRTTNDEIDDDVEKYVKNLQSENRDIADFINTIYGISDLDHISALSIGHWYDITKKWNTRLGVSDEEIDDKIKNFTRHLNKANLDFCVENNVVNGSLYLGLKEFANSIRSTHAESRGMAEYIYTNLNKKGAELGNFSITLIKGFIESYMAIHSPRTTPKPQERMQCLQCSIPRPIKKGVQETACIKCGRKVTINYK